MATQPALALRRLNALRERFDSDATGRKLVLLRSLARETLSTPAQVRALHELLCFWRAYPDTPALLALVERLLSRFASRADLTRARTKLLNSGIAGTDIVYPFGRLTARWLASRWGNRLSIEWAQVDDEDRLARTLILLALPAEVPGLDQAPRPPRAWLEYLRRPHRTDAAYLVDRASRVPVSELARDRLYEELGVACRLTSGPGTPSRTSAKVEGWRSVTYQATPLRRGRPDLRADARRPPEAIRAVDAAAGARLIDLAREGMVTRERDLDGFVWADARDVRIAECGDGLQFVCIGALPDRRFLLESVYGFLTLKNGVPIGYALASGLRRFSEVAYNVFETFRGAEAAHVYGRLLGTIHALFGSETFTIDPYQLGHENDEGLDSGAWWFYYKLGFRPRSRAALALVRKETGRLANSTAYRTPRTTLARIVRYPLFFSLAPPGQGARVEGLRLDRIGLAVTGYVTSRWGSDRERAATECAAEVAQWLGVSNWRLLPTGARHAFERWAPLVAVLPGVAEWSVEDRRALEAVICAKGGRRESDFVRAFDRHPRLGAAVTALAKPPRPR